MIYARKSHRISPVAMLKISLIERRRSTLKAVINSVSIHVMQRMSANHTGSEEFLADNVFLVTDSLDKLGKIILNLHRVFDIFQNNLGCGINLRINRNGSCAADLLSKGSGKSQVGNAVKQGLVIIRCKETGLHIKSLVSYLIFGKRPREPQPVLSVFPFNFIRIALYEILTGLHRLDILVIIISHNQSFPVFPLKKVIIMSNCLLLKHYYIYVISYF